MGVQHRNSVTVADRRGRAREGHAGKAARRVAAGMDVAMGRGMKRTLLLMLMLQAGCLSRVGVRIDPTIRVPPPLPSIAGPRPVAAAELAHTRRDEFVEDEVLFRPRDPAELAAFIDRYHASILRDGGKEGDRTGGWYLLKVDLARSPFDDLADHLKGGKLTGVLRFSSERGARLIALVAREALAGHRVEANLLWSGQSVLEHPDPNAPTGFSDAETWWYMNEQDDPNAPEQYGLSIGVVHAWRFLDYVLGGSRPVPTIAIIDGGFDLDPVSGLPLHDNLDYTNDLRIAPRQYALSSDFHGVSSDGPHAGGENPWLCGGNPCPWHGQEAFSIAAGFPNNHYGTAGSSGGFARPLLIRVEPSSFTVATAIRGASIDGAEVISLSLSTCFNSWYCDTPFYDAVGAIDEAVKFATTWNNAIVVAAAGNDGNDIGDNGPLPCATGRVLCVGTIDPTNKMNVYNYGTRVDIWAPDRLWATPTPANPGLHSFGGTSASAPFVAGIVALMKVADPAIDWKRARDVLVQTANTVSDPRVHSGYVDAYRAVAALRTNQPPTIAIITPSPGAFLPGRIDLSARVDDPEAASFGGTVTWTLDGAQACMGTSCEQVVGSGRHTITAHAVDPFGAEATASVVIANDNHTPQVFLTNPTAGLVAHAGQLVDFRGSSFDADGSGDPVTLAWTSSLAGDLGGNAAFQRALPVGHHVITLRATDGAGASATATVEIDVDGSPGFPSATILAPANGRFVRPHTSITLEGSANDPEDGPLSGTHLSWSSDRDGVLGTGATLAVTLSGPDVCEQHVQHHVTLTATDSAGHQATTTIIISVGKIC